MRGDNTPAVEDGRYYKFFWHDADGVPPIGTLDHQPKGGAFRMFSHGVFRGSRLQAFPTQKAKGELGRLGCCAYCGRTHSDGEPLKLTSEHVIPEFLGAGLELPEASCGECQEVTKKFEDAIAREIFDPVRKNLNLVGKKAVLRKSNFPVDVGRETTDARNVPVADHPTILTLPRFYPASAYSTRPYATNGMFNFLMRNLNVDKSSLAKHGVGGFSTQAIDMVRFCQLVAKIAHVYAVAHFGHGSFEPAVADFIRTNFEKGTQCSSHFDHVGCLWDREADSPHLHEVEVGTMEWKGESLIAGRVRLFASFGMPSYHVAVGRPRAPHRVPGAEMAEGTSTDPGR